MIIYFQPLVLHECKNSYKGLELEDRIEEGNIALLYAIRTYKIHYGYFSEYAVNQIRKIMKQKNANAWAEKKLNSRASLDAPLRNNAGNEKFTLADYIGQETIDDTLPDVKCFMGSLSVIEQRILRLRMEGHSLQSAATTIAISLESVKRILQTIESKHVSYYRNARDCMDCADQPIDIN